MFCLKLVIFQVKKPLWRAIKVLRYQVFNQFTDNKKPIDKFLYVKTHYHFSRKKQKFNVTSLNHQFKNCNISTRERTKNDYKKMTSQDNISQYSIDQVRLRELRVLVSSIH